MAALVCYLTRCRTAVPKCLDGVRRALEPCLDCAKEIRDFIVFRGVFVRLYEYEKNTPDRPASTTKCH